MDTHNPSLFSCSPSEFNAAPGFASAFSVLEVRQWPNTPPLTARKLSDWRFTGDGGSRWATRVGASCSFDALVTGLVLHNKALDLLATNVRGAAKP